jgi:hypothetical protein
MMLLAVAAAFLVVDLDGCAAQQTREAAGQARTCLSAAYNAPEAASIRAHEP